MRRSRPSGRQIPWILLCAHPGIISAIPARMTIKAAFRHGEGQILDAGGPLYRRRRTRRDAPFLCPLLHQGYSRHRADQFRRAFPAAVQPGHHHLPAHEDEQVPRAMWSIRTTMFRRLGADTVRAYLMFIGPWEQGGDWNDSGISGIFRWLNRIWNLVLEGYNARSGE